MSTHEELLNSGDLNTLAKSFGAVKAGTLLKGEGTIRFIKETVAIEEDSALATPAYPILKLIRAKTIDVGGEGEKAVLKQGGTPSTGEAAAATDGLTVNFEATETTGAGTALLIYATTSKLPASEAFTASFGAGF